MTAPSSAGGGEVTKESHTRWRQGRGARPPRTYRCSSSLRSHSPPDGGRAPVLRTVALPVGPTPDGDMRLAEGQEHEHRRCVVPTVHCMGRCREKGGSPARFRKHGFPPATHLAVLVLRSYQNVAYRHALSLPPGAGNDCRNGRSLSTAGANDDFPEARLATGQEREHRKVRREGGRAPLGASEECRRRGRGATDGRPELEKTEGLRVGVVEEGHRGIPRPS
ncbi:MAG: hypothetical protein PWR21_1786 [Methanoculleus sp.]|nr:hypothetical protein [Methanoculleus sp.]